MKGVEEHERAIPTADVPEKGLMAGDVGTVVSVHDVGAGGRPAGYTLELFSLPGETIALATVAAGCVRFARATDITHARSA